MPRLLRFLLASVSAGLVGLTALRGVFWRVFHNPDDAIPLSTLGQALYLGFKFDLRLLLLVHLPILLLGWIRVLDPFRTRLGRRLWTGYLTGVTGAVLVFYLFDFGHYGYLEARIDATILRFLYNPYESFGVVWESYPVLPGLALLGLVLGVSALWFHWLLSRPAPSVPVGPGRRIAVVAGFVLAFAFGIYGKLSYYPLRWSDAFFTTQPFVAAMTLNPVLYFFDTLQSKEIDYDVGEVRRHYDRMASYLGVERRDPERLNFTRRQLPARQVPRRPNVVLVFLESFAYYKTGLSGNPLDPSPHFDALAREGLLFRCFYSAHAGTARAVFASLTGLPDVEPDTTSTRNPVIVNQHTLINAFEGYEKLYFIGGSANWGNIRGLLSHNIPGLRLYEEGDYPAERVDVWGVSDLHLFEEANRVLREIEGRPFFAVIHTAGNHKPYRLPEDTRGFETSSASEAEVRRYGFPSPAAFDGFRFMDHAIGFFLEAARREGYFANTIFAFYGDHGSPGRAAHRPPGEDLLTLTRFHVPFLIYGPGWVPPGVVDTVGTQADILPTLAALSGTPGINSTLGRDLLDPRFDGTRYAFTITGRAPTIGLITQDHYFVENADRSDRRLHRIVSDDPLRNRVAELPDLAAQLEQYTQGIYQTARYLRYHNAPELVAELADEEQGFAQARR